ncbi:uncharacterized protein [Amphiura filiformis]|uniref:uncharacterized protein n=1 Tax=Amphiura filiformis TaxID=82378 RepID=UPI003B216B03
MLVVEAFTTDGRVLRIGGRRLTTKQATKTSDVALLIGCTLVVFFIIFLLVVLTAYVIKRKRAERTTSKHHTNGYIKVKMSASWQKDSDITPNDTEDSAKPPIKPERCS